MNGREKHKQKIYDMPNDQDITEAVIMPSGVVLAFAGKKIPSGWRECNGEILNRKAFPDLFEAIGTAHGGDADEGFRLPDFRGRFLRGCDHGAGTDPGAGSRTSPFQQGPNPGNQGDNVGSLQDDDLKAHNHPLHYESANLTSTGPGSYSHIHPTAQPVKDDGAITARGGAETRPKNAYVTFIIKL